MRAVGAKILSVEDEELVGAMVRLNLEAEGYKVVWSRRGSEALEITQHERFDLILLDIGLPGVDGVQVLREIRRRGIGTPILMLTARSDVPTKVRTLGSGADDYLAKPFDVAELLARVAAILRRSQAERELPSDQLLRFDRYEVNLRTREATTNLGRVTLSEKEAAFLALLAKAQGEVLTRNDILDEVWGMDAMPTERTVDNLVLRVRKLFEPDAENPVHILTVRGTGYRFRP
jgi:DNA-binding response OmpR family regulator